MRCDLVDLPSEILVRIMVSCLEDADSFAELFSLASTCRQFRELCTSSLSHVIWDVGNRLVLCFEDAVIAVRATEQVKLEFMAGKPPPDIASISSLGRPAGDPSLAEIVAVLDLQHLVLCVKTMFLEWDFDEIARELRWVSPQNGNWAETQDSWTERFHSAAYGVFIAGAVLSRAYYAPFFGENSKAKDSFMAAYMEDFNSAVICEKTCGPDDGCSCEMSKSMQDLAQQEYLRRYVVYDPEACEMGDIDRQTTTFGVFSEWLMKDSVACSQKKQYTPIKNSRLGLDETTIGRVWTVTQLIAAYEHISTKLASAAGQYNHAHARCVRDLDTPPAVEETVSTRTTTIVVFGSFVPEEITMPHSASDAKKTVIRARKIGQRLHEDPALLLDRVFEPYHSPPPGQGRRAGWPSPPPPLQLFEFMLRKYCSLQFADRAWELFADAPYREFLDYANAFSADTGENGGYGMMLYQAFRG